MMGLSDRCLVVVQCRYDSVRLPGKAMMTINNVPMASFLLKRLRSCLPSDKFLIVLATTKKRGDDAVAKCGMDNGVEVVRGEDRDVLRRYLQCLERVPADIVVRVTADNPLTCPHILERAAKEIVSQNSDYLKCESVPLGTGVDVFTSGILKEMDVKAKDPDEREHINLYILRHKEDYRITFLSFEVEGYPSSLRFTVDTKEDLENIRSLLRDIGDEAWRLPIHEIVKKMGSPAAPKR